MDQPRELGRFQIENDRDAGMEQGYTILMDVGGSFIKYAAANRKGELVPDSIGEMEANASGSEEEVFTAIREIIRLVRRTRPVTGACVSMPGPFDYDNGVSYMKHKFPALYGKSLRAPFEREGLAVAFLHDSTAFILGEYYDGVLRDAQNPCCVMLGTGLGFAWMRGGLVMVDDNQTPAMTLWRSPYLDGIAEDYVSTRAIRQYYGNQLSVKEIAEQARAGDARAAEAFRITAGHLSAILTPLLSRLHCDKFALGGQIAKSADLMPLELPVPWEVSNHLNDAALLGAAWYICRGRDACIQIVPRLEYFEEKRNNV